MFIYAYSGTYSRDGTIILINGLVVHNLVRLVNIDLISFSEAMRNGSCSITGVNEIQNKVLKMYLSLTIFQITRGLPCDNF